MAKLSDTELLARYREKLSHSKRWRQDEKFDDLWKRLIDLYRGKHYKTAKQEDQLLVNIAFATINVISPATSINHPKITVNAKEPSHADHAVVTEAIINYWWKHFGYQDEFRLAVKDFLILGHGWLKTGYRFVEEDQTQDETPNFDSFDDTTTPGPEAAIESNLIIKEDRAFLERVSPFDIYVDPDATSMATIRWIAQRTRRPMEDIREDKKYNLAARVAASPSSYSKWGEDNKKPVVFGDKDAYAEVWEFYDVDRNKMSVFCDGGDKFLVAPQKMPFAFGHPYEMLRNYDIPDHFYSMGELEAIEPLQHELNATRTQMMNHRKRYSRKWLFRESAFDTTGREGLQSDEDNRLVPVKTEGPLLDAVAPMPALINPPEFYNQSNLISEDVRWVSGLNEYQGGGIPEIRRTATEAAIIQDAANARVSDKLAIIEKSIGSCARKLIMLAQQYLTGEQAVRIVGSEAEPVWLEYDREFIQGEFDFDVEGGSTQPVNESFRRQMAMQVVDAMAPFANAGILDMPKLARYVLQYGFGIRGAGSFIIERPMMPVPQQGVGPDGQPLPEPVTPGGAPMPQDMPQGMDPNEMAQGMPPTGGGPMPSNIPPEIMAQLLAGGVSLNNTQPA